MRRGGLRKKARQPASSWGAGSPSESRESDRTEVRSVVHAWVSV